MLDPALNPYNVLEPGKRPRVTLTPSLAFKDGKPWLAFAVQGGDSQDQNLLQFLLNVVEFGMTPQEAAEAANFESFQMRSSFDKHESQPGRLVLNESVPQWVRKELAQRGYKLEFQARTSGPDQRHPARPRARHDVGRLEQPRRGLRHRVVIPRPPCRRACCCQSRSPRDSGCARPSRACRRRAAAVADSAPGRVARRSSASAIRSSPGSAWTGRSER